MATISWTLGTPPPVAPAASLATPYHGSYYYGTTYYGAFQTFAATLRGRLLQFVRGGPNYSLVYGAYADRCQGFVNSAEAVRDSFDLDVASGDRLDKLGTLLQRPRNGLSDADYLIAIQIQIELILSSTASSDTMLAIVLLFTGQEAPEYTETYPLGFSVGAVVPNLAEAQRLLGLICEAKGGGFRHRLAAFLTSDTIFGDIIAAPLTDPGSSDIVGPTTVSDAYASSLLLVGT